MQCVIESVAGRSMQNRWRDQRVLAAIVVSPARAPIAGGALRGDTAFPRRLATTALDRRWCHAAAADVVGVRRGMRRALSCLVAAPPMPKTAAGRSFSGHVYDPNGS